MNVTTASLKRLAIRARLESIGARRVVHIGAFLGKHTSIIRDVVRQRGGYVAVIDPMNWASEVLRCGPMRQLCGAFPRLIERAESALSGLSYEPMFWRNTGHEGVVLFRSLTTDATLLESPDRRLRDLDAVFIDMDHCHAGTKHDLLRWGSRVRPGGLILVHDATERFVGVRRAVEDSWPPVVVEFGLESESLCSVRVLNPRSLSVQELAVA